MVARDNKRYLFLIGSLKKGGAERNLALVASHLAEMGHAVEIAVFENTIEFPLHKDIGYFVLSVYYRRVPTRHNRCFCGKV